MLGIDKMVNFKQLLAKIVPSKEEDRFKEIQRTCMYKASYVSNDCHNKQNPYNRCSIKCCPLIKVTQEPKDI